MRKWIVGLLTVALISAAAAGWSASRMARYYAHETVEDRYGVIAPWYTGLNGQCDMRVRIAMETLKRYPWTPPGKAPAEYPEYLWNGNWNISPEGVITIPEQKEWDNGDLIQRASFTTCAMADYYRYTGDAAAIPVMKWIADLVLDYYQTSDTHPWPRFPISVPTRGKSYGSGHPKGFIQLDMSAEVGSAILRTYQITGDPRYFAAAKHWGDLLAQHCNLTPGAEPWGRYANPEMVQWGNKMTGGVAYILFFLDELIRLGYTGTDNSIIAARDAGRAYFRGTLLPKWTVVDTWGRHFWDWEAFSQLSAVTEVCPRYMMANKDYFPNWRNDVRNILALYLNHTSVDPLASSDTFGGAWAFPESYNCCWSSLWYSPMHLAWMFSQYGVEADSEWGRELGRRQQILATYDVHEDGNTEDNIHGGCIVNATWFKIAHPTPIKHVLETIGWLPEILGANRENHIVRCSAEVTSVVYGDGRISYTTFDAPADTTTVLRLAFVPKSVKADGKALKARSALGANGYILKALANGDQILSIRHDGARSVTIEGDDPQQVADDNDLTYEGEWQVAADSSDFGGRSRTAGQSGCSASYTFTGNQVRLIGRFSPEGGKADVYVDGVKQLAGIDSYNPTTRSQQILYYKNGLAQGEHTLKIVVAGAKNPYSSGTSVCVDCVQWSDATGGAGFGEGGGPKGHQRVIFGYTSREDYTDSKGNKWMPGMEAICRLGANADSVAQTWWTEPTSSQIEGTEDQELYRYGMHAREFTVNFTVGPGRYHARLKFAATRAIDPLANCVTIFINGRRLVKQMNVEATAGGSNRAVDLVFNDINPRNGVIEIRFVGGDSANSIDGEAYVQAIEIGPGSGGTGAEPVGISLTGSSAPVDSRAIAP